ncbi:hypothetical protein POVWA2_002790 [Plasmodium ovale wallikeri]|uniref:PIR Superfamily Protein n=1 Tax=Plasmodium ovale wallikeri TaxID=864142 RepID=A0A1A8YHZ8_PLAOA|nr:hypothetical protein POVWA2_002790 [Plasmodium ovale wallikeri]SBT57225.1 hypothetical protein POVWA1_080800 [Plasmodium ovale wallikeri]
MVNVTFLNHDSSDQERKDRCFDVLSDIQSTIEEIAKLSNTRENQRLLLQKCNALINYLDSYRSIKKGCYDHDFYYHRNYIKNSIHKDLKKCNNYEEITKLMLQVKDLIVEVQEIKEAHREVKDAKHELTQPVIEARGKSSCSEKPCSAENSENQELTHSSQDLGDKGEKADAQHISGSSQKLGHAKALATPNKEEPAGDIDGFSTPDERETTKRTLHIPGNSKVHESHTGSNIPLHGRTGEDSSINGHSHAQGLRKVHDLHVDLSAEAPLTLPPPPAGERTSTGISSSQGTYSVSGKALSNGMLSPAGKHSPDHFSLSVAASPVGQLPSAEQQSPSQVVLPNLEPKSDHAGEPHKGQSQEQIDSQGNFSCSNFTPVREIFSKNKKTKRQKIREELDKIMYSPLNFEEDNIYLSYSRPEYSFYDAEYEN